MKMKKLLSAIISAVASFTLIIPYNSIATLQEEYEFGVLRDVVESIGEVTYMKLNVASRFMDKTEYKRRN